jgi:hypothetical protein
VEFQLIGGRWTSEGGERVEVGAILAGDVAYTSLVMGNTPGLMRAAV